MSHFTRIRTRLVERDGLEKALEDMGLGWEEGPARGFGGQMAMAEIRVQAAQGYDIGFQVVNGAYEAVADWGMAGIRADEFLGRLTQRYAYHVTKRQLEEQGFGLVEEEVGADGRIHLLMRRMG